MPSPTAELTNAIEAMLTELRNFVTGAVVPATVPSPSVYLTRMEERSSGLGGLTATRQSDGFGLAPEKAARLRGGVRFQWWAGSADAAEAAISALNADLVSQIEPLKEIGFLEMQLDAVSVTEHVEAIPAWRQTADYSVLFEHRYEDSDDADSLITRIPVTLPDTPGEDLVVTGAMVRWDDESAADLAVMGPSAVLGLSAFSFITGVPTGTVTVTRTFDGAGGAPAAHADLDDFLTAVSGDSPAETHSSVTFPSLNAFVGALGAPTHSEELGDFDEDGVPDSYDLRARSIDPPIQLTQLTDRLEISFGDAQLDTQSVVYIRARRGPALTR